MFELIKPPTDNLYKFAAIFGLVLFVVGFVFPPWLFYRSSLEYLKSVAGESELAAYRKFTDDRSKILNARRQQMEAERNELQKRLDRMTSLKSNTGASSEIDQLESAIKDAKKQVETLEDASNELSLNLDLKIAQAKQQQTFSTNETRNSRLVVVVGWIIAAVGLLLALAGFIIWYRRVQVFLDKILQKEATSKINALAAVAQSGEADE